MVQACSGMKPADCTVLTGFRFILWQHTFPLKQDKKKASKAIDLQQLQPSGKRIKSEKEYGSCAL